MIKKILAFTICLFLFIQVGFAKKRTVKQRELISVQKATFSLVQNQIRKVGNIYELNITVHANDVSIDSVWFGATPVPCDVYETKTLHRIPQPLLKGKYLVKANQNLYENFYRNIDSTFAYNHFVAPFLFKGTLVIMYSYKGKRYYKTVLKAEEKPQKMMRE